jgi:hypothetical protein
MRNVRGLDNILKVLDFILSTYARIVTNFSQLLIQDPTHIGSDVSRCWPLCQFWIGSLIHAQPYPSQFTIWVYFYYVLFYFSILFLFLWSSSLLTMFLFLYLSAKIWYFTSCLWVLTICSLIVKKSYWFNPKSVSVQRIFRFPPIQWTSCFSCMSGPTPALVSYPTDWTGWSEF